MQRSSNNLPRQSTIFRSLIAGFLLALFALGITPKLALHDLLAHHTDESVLKGHSRWDQVAATGYNCALDQLVAESPFTPTAITVLPVLFSSYPVVYASPILSYDSQPHWFAVLRGPPAIS